MTFDHKKHSLGQVENFLYDAMSSGATPQEIYDVIKGVVEDNYYTYKKSAAEAYELLALLNGNGKGHIKAYDDCVDKILSCNKDDTSPECEGAWNSFWEEETPKSTVDRVVKWILPVEEIKSIFGDLKHPPKETEEEKARRYMLEKYSGLIIPKKY
jgi:hypothetical protein